MSVTAAATPCNRTEPAAAAIGVTFRNRTSTRAAFVWWLTIVPLLLSGAELPSIHFANGYALTGGQVMPAIPAEYARPAEESVGSVWIVQCRGPIEHRWLEQLAGIGARPMAYLPRQAVVVEAATGRERLAGLDFVVAVSPFEPVFKVAREVMELDSPAELLAVPFPGRSADSLAEIIFKSGIPVARVAGGVVTVRSDRNGAAAIARLDAVQWIQPSGHPVPFNDNVQWVMQTGWQPAIPPDSTGRRIWSEGIRGQGIVLSVADGGLNTDHDMFRDDAIPIRDAGVYLHHRKVVAYKLYNSAVFGVGRYKGYHGTHATGTAAGNDAPNGNSSLLDGIAPDAKICFVDVENGSGVNVVNPEDIGALLDTIYSGRGLGFNIRQTSFSWGWGYSGGNYYLQDAATDAACWQCPDLLIVCAAGNDGFRIAHPSVAKNALAVGATGNGIWSDTLFLPQCHGPAHDGRNKPDLVAPGIGVVSATGPNPSHYDSMTGTSMATPAVNGACALIRQYLNDGWYPTGQPVPSHRMSDPSSALIRALAIASTDPNVRRAGSQAYVPDRFIGWGRMDLDSVLYFAGDARHLFLVDDAQGLATGESREFDLNVTAQIPLRAVLCWTDTAGSPDVEPALVNDLDLEVSGAGQGYRGNQYLNGESVQNPDGWDSINTIECFRINHPALGLWQFFVRARNVVTSRQPFALVVTGALPDAGVTASPGSASPLAMALTPNPVRHQLAIACSQPEGGMSRLSVFDVRGRSVRTIQRGPAGPGRHLFDWNLADDQGKRIPAGVYFVKFRAGERDVTRKLVVAE